MAKAQKTEFAGEKWDRKKIFIAILVTLALAISGLELKAYFLDSNSSKSTKRVGSLEDIKGTSVSLTPTISLPSAQQIGEEVAQNLKSIKQDISNINVQEVATLSPQVKKILDDIGELPNYPGSYAKDICIKFCSGL
ncbi:MAG: hypothetical protein HYU48_00020 [Candidatus Levybacteria bacterium]|nr:hypothetical protein [Candidatus Levybacteria bacterium]